MIGAKTPGAFAIAFAALVGFFGYGVSLSLFILALRHIGTARTGAYFSSAPFVGAVVSMLILGDKLTVNLTAAAALMGLGVWLHLTEAYEHEHWHPPMVHEHRHSHDEHHQHEHEGEVYPGNSHSHKHAHVGLLHSHPHYPDIHHRH
jgi:EamA-like transporter family protein